MNETAELDDTLAKFVEMSARVGDELPWNSLPTVEDNGIITGDKTADAVKRDNGSANDLPCFMFILPQIIKRLLRNQAKSPNTRTEISFGHAARLENSLLRSRARLFSWSYRESPALKCLSRAKLQPRLYIDQKLLSNVESYKRQF